MRKIAYLAVALAVVTTTSIGTHTALAYAQEAKSQKIAQAESEKKANQQKADEKKAAEAKQQEAPKPVLVTVAAGDSLSTIATANNTTWVRIFNANESIANPDIINPGQQLRIPNADEQLADRPLAAPAPAPVATTYQASTRSTKPRAAAASYPVSSNAAKAFIYARESGNNPNATNPNGCYGIGQDCNGVVRAKCGANYACQDQHFTNYAMGRYGSWEAAYAFWQKNHWW